MESSHLHRIEEFLRNQSALCFAGRRNGALRCYVEERIAQLGLSGPASYEGVLRSSREEQAKLYDLVTVNETSFFRNRLQFEDLRTRIVPELEEERGRRLVRQWGEGRDGSGSFRKLRILSAGCSTGEEPYSLAMTLLASLRYPLAWDLQIVAADLSEACLAFAARGRYPESRLRGIPEEYRERYLRKVRGEWEMRDEVKALVRFQRVNLAQVMAGEPFPGLGEGFAGFDAIFCRNVMIYFPPTSQQLLVDTLQNLLAPGGYLFTGDAEPLHLYRHDLETVAGVEALIYRKPGEQAAATAPPPSPADLSGCGAEELLRLVADSSLGLRGDAMQRLLAMELREIAPALERGVRDNGDAEYRNGAMECLVAFGERSVPMLLSLLADGDPEVRNFSAVMLGSIGSGRAVPHLIRALRDPELNVRHAAAESLGKIGDPLALDALLDLLDQGFWLQYAALGALGELGNAGAVPRLLELLDDELMFEPTVQALQKIGSRSALPALRAVTRSPDPRRGRMAAQAVCAIEQRVPLSLAHHREGGEQCDRVTLARSFG